MIVAGEIYRKILFILNDPFGNTFPEGDFLFLLNSNLSKVLRKFQINKRVFYISLFPYVSEYYTISRGGYRGQIVDDVLSITALYSIKNNTPYKVEFVRNEFINDIYSNDNTITKWTGSSIRIKVYPTPLRNNRVIGGFNFQTLSFTTPTKLTPPIPIVVFARNQQTTILAYQLEYHVFSQNGQDYTYTNPEVRYMWNTQDPQNYSYEVYLADVAYEGILTRTITSLDEPVDIETDFIDYLCYLIIAEQFETYRLYNDATIYRTLAMNEEKRLLNSFIFTKTDPFVEGSKIYGY